MNGYRAVRFRPMIQTYKYLKTMETIKNIFAFFGMMFLFFGGMMADNKSLVPTISAMIMGIIFIIFYKMMEKEEKED